MLERQRIFSTIKNLITSLVFISLAACGGGGGSGFGVDPPGSGGWIPGQFLAVGTYINMCAAPRAGIDPATGQPYPDLQGTTTDENNFLRSLSNDTYLWYDEITDRDPAIYATPAYFDLLKTEEMTASSQPKDKFHFTYPSDEWYELSQSGVSAGYGAEFALISRSPPREIIVAYTDPNTPATDPAVALARGVEMLVADGVDVINGADVDTLNAAFFPSQPGEMHTFTVRDLGGSERDISMTSASVTSTPVRIVDTITTAMGDVVGYMQFNDHIATAESGLIAAINQLKAAGITDLFIDMRYNGGGYLDIASELSFMIAGSGPTAGQVFEDLRFNDKHPTTNPITGQSLSPTPFHTTTQGFDVAPGQALPTLDLSRVFVLTGPGTCSASESIMNGLEGVDVEVFQIGSTTCGKPYGFYAIGNCGTTYFTIQFKGENNKGFGDYTDGFSAANQTGAVGTVLPGCSVADDFTQALGDPAEGRLAAALMYRENQTCPMPASGVAATGQAKTMVGTDLSAVDGVMPKNVWRQNRIIRR